MAQATIDTTVSGIQGVPVSSTPPTVGQILIFNGTAWVPGTNINGPLSIAGVLTAGSVAAGGGNFSGTLVSTGGIQATGSAVIQSPGNAGNLVNGSGLNLFTQRGFSFSTLGTVYTNPNGTYLAAGVNCSFIPRTSGTVLVLCRIALMFDGNSGTFCVLSYGTGSPPGQGTDIGSFDQIGNGVQGGYGGSAWSNSGALNGILQLNVGTQYWFDVAVVGPLSVQYVNIWIQEL